MEHNIEHLTESENWKELLETALANGIDITSFDNKNWPLTHRFAFKNNLEGLRWCKDNGVPFDDYDRYLVDTSDQ